MDERNRSCLCLPKTTQALARNARATFLLYYITDRKQFAGSPRDQEEQLLEKIRECSATNVDFIQLREKDLSTRELESLAGNAMRALAPGSTTKLLVNTRIDVAIAAGAHGVHLPSNCLSASEARAIFARARVSRPVIAVSTHSATEVDLAEAHGADFAVFGPVFEKSRIANAAGIQQLAGIAGRSQASAPPMPVLALGGVTLDNAAVCIEAGATGIAGIRLFQAGNTIETVQKLRKHALASRTARRS